MAGTHASKEVVWMHRICSIVSFVKKFVRLYYDSQSATFLAKNPTYHDNTKHVYVQYHFVKDMVEAKKVLLKNIDTLKNAIDSLTKYDNIKKLSWCRESMSIDALKL